jgi:hypothetical protein
MSIYRVGGRQPVTTARLRPVGHGEPGIEPESDGPGPLAASLAGTVGIVFPDGLGLSTIDLGCWLRTLGLGCVADFGQDHRLWLRTGGLGAHRPRALGRGSMPCMGGCWGQGGVRRGGGHGLGHGGVGLGHGCAFSMVIFGLWPVVLLRTIV